MEPTIKLDLMRALALLPFVVFVPLVLVSLMTPVRIAVERRNDRKMRERHARVERGY